MNAFTTSLLQGCFLFASLALLTLACERDLDELRPVTNPTNPEVFIDGFSPGLNYAAFGGSVPTAFQVDNEVTYNNISTASMRFEVPDVGDPRGAYAGGTYFTETGRDLSQYNALTFWIKATKAANIDVIGFGNDLGASRFVTTINGLAVNTNWRKVIIPLPDPSKLTNERGMFFYSEGAEEGRGYTFWIDEVKFENLGTLAHPQHAMLFGEDQVETSFVGVTKNIAGLSSTYNLPSGINQRVNAAPAYFEFASSNPAIATVDANGTVTVVGGPGEAVITATVGGTRAAGSLTVQSVGNFERAPTPTRNPNDVISIYTEAYPNVPVNYYNGYWAPFQTTGSADFSVAGDNILHYTNFNFVGIEFSAPTVNATAMTHLHVDIYLPNLLTADARFKIEVVDFGSGGTGAFTTTIPVARSQQWIGLDIPFTSLAGLSNRMSLAQIIFVDDNGVIPNFYADNIYFYREGTTPVMAPNSPAPPPTHPAATVTSIFSDAYANVAGTNLNPDWGQATQVAQVSLQGNNTLRYTGLNYQGIELGSPQDVSARGFLQLDVWTANSTALNVYLISPGPVETPFSITVPTTGWSRVSIPLSAFAPVNLTNVIQLKFDGNGDIFLDNIYFRN